MTAIKKGKNSLILGNNLLGQRITPKVKKIFCKKCCRESKTTAIGCRSGGSSPDRDVG